MNEYRCTRNYLYHCFRNYLYRPPCDGKQDTSPRGGYYVRANTEAEALVKMQEQFPQEIGFGFTVEYWKTIPDELATVSLTPDPEMEPVPIEIIHPKLLKSYPIPGDGTQADGCITLKEWRPNTEWVTHFHNLQTGGAYYGRYFTNLAEAEANFRQRILEFGGVFQTK